VPILITKDQYTFGIFADIYFRQKNLKQKHLGVEGRLRQSRVHQVTYREYPKNMEKKNLVSNLNEKKCSTNYTRAG